MVAGEDEETGTTTTCAGGSVAAGIGLARAPPALEAVILESFVNHTVRVGTPTSRGTAGEGGLERTGTDDVGGHLLAHRLMLRPPSPGRGPLAVVAGAQQRHRVIVPAPKLDRHQVVLPEERDPGRHPRGKRAIDGESLLRWLPGRIRRLPPSGDVIRHPEADPEIVADVPADQGRRLPHPDAPRAVPVAAARKEGRAVAD